MNLIIRPARGGKTAALIKISAETKCPIICFNAGHVKDVQLLAKQLGFKIPEPIHHSKLPVCDNGLKAVLVDNADELLETLIGRPVMAASLTGVVGNSHLKTDLNIRLNQIDPQEFRTMYYGEWKAEEPDDSGIESALEDMP